MKSKMCLQAIFLGLFLHFADTPVFADDPPITGITIDEELSQLLKQIVPYKPQEQNALPKEKRFLFNLNKLINEDLAARDEKYKLAACKLALRMALAINKTVDSLEVRRYPFNRSVEPCGEYSAQYGLNIKDDFWWILGGEIEDRKQWDDYWGGVTSPLFFVNRGRISQVDVRLSTNACGGMFSSCCDTLVCPSGLNDVWRQHFVDLGRPENFPRR